MADLNLQNNEGILIKYDSYMSSNYKFIDELYLTNINIIIVKSKGFFKTTYEIDKFPLSKIKCINNVPLVNVRDNKDENNWELIVQFKNENLNIEFPYKFLTKNKIYQEVSNIANQICKNVNGTSASLIDNSNTILGSVKNILGIKDKTIPEQTNTIKCIGCMAPLSGLKGQIVKCKYCDMSQSL